MSEEAKKEVKSFFNNMLKLNTWCYFIAFLVIMWGAYTLGSQQGNSDMCSSLGGQMAKINKVGQNNIMCILDQELIRENQKFYINSPELMYNMSNTKVGIYE